MTVERRPVHIKLDRDVVRMVDVYGAMRDLYRNEAMEELLRAGLARINEPTPAYCCGCAPCCWCSGLVLCQVVWPQLVTMATTARIIEPKGGA